MAVWNFLNQTLKIANALPIQVILIAYLKKLSFSIHIFRFVTEYFPFS
jgi:hypothetical protein